MSSWAWDMALFAWGFLAGCGVAFGAVAVARLHGRASRQGERLVAKLGPVDSRRFLEVVSD